MVREEVVAVGPHLFYINCGQDGCGEQHGARKQARA